MILKTIKNKYLWVAAIIAVVVFLDLLTKYLVMKTIHLHDVVPVIPGFFNLTHVRNPGAAFGILANASGAWRVAFFITVSLGALGVIATLVRKTAERLPLVAYALVAGGAVGNLIDRVRFGEVVDFINVHLWKGVAYLDPWPTFNVADSAITVGVVLLAADMLFMQKDLSTNAQASNDK